MLPEAASAILASEAGLATPAAPASEAGLATPEDRGMVLSAGHGECLSTGSIATEVGLATPTGGGAV